MAIEELVKERYELPAFSTLDRLVIHIRAVINNRLFRKVARSLSLTEISYLDSLLIDNPDSDSATLNEVKQLPKKATLTQIKKLLAKFERLMAFGDAKRLFSTIATTKIEHFAARKAKLCQSSKTTICAYAQRSNLRYIRVPRYSSTQT